MIENYVASVSTYSGDIDALILLIAVLVGFWLVLCEAILIGFVIKFRAKPGVRAQYITGEETHQKRWINIPHYLVLVCDIIIIVGAVQIWYDVKQNMPEPDTTIRVVGQQWAWSFVHPGPDNLLDTGDDIKTVDDLHVPVGKVVHFELEARDVLHSFSVPVFRLKQDAIPGRTIKGWFEATDTGVFDIQCAEICGIGHGIMAGRIHIESASEHASWMAKNSPMLAANPSGFDPKRIDPELITSTRTAALAASN